MYGLTVDIMEMK